MRKNNGWTRAPWFAIGLLAGALGATWVHPEGISASTEHLEVPLRNPGEGHGAYCDIPENGWYFYGRDLNRRVGSFTDLVDWCDDRDGEIGWIE